MRGKVFRALVLAGALALAGVASAAGPEQEIPSAADFGALPTLTSPVISADGQYVAALGLTGGKQVVLILSTPSAPRRFNPIAVPDRHEVEWIRWCGSHRLLVNLAKVERRGDQEVRTRRAELLDLDRGTQSFLEPNNVQVAGDAVFHFDPAGKFLLMRVSGDAPGASVYRLDLETGKYARIQVGKDGVWYWFADSAGTLRLGVGEVEQRQLLYYRRTEAERFRRIVGAKVTDTEHQIERFELLPGSDIGFAIATGASGRFGLYRYDFSGTALGEPVYEHPGVDIDDFELGSDGKPAGVFYDDDKPEVTWFSPELKKIQASLDRAVPGYINRVISASADRARLIVWSASADDPGTYYLFDRKTATMHAIADSFPALVNKRLAPMEPVRYKARDGLELRGYLTMPAGRGDKKLPMVVMPHGGPFARDSWGYDPWVQYLASKGYVVLQTNFRGSTGFGTDFVKKGVGQWGRGMQDDIDDGVKWLVAKGAVDPGRVCIMGGSFGGYAAMWAAVRNPEIYRCAISFAGVSDVASMLRYDRRAMSAPRYFRDWQERVQGDKDFELDTVSPIKQVDRMTAPILLAHGEDDDNVPLYQSRRLHEALLKLKRPHEYVVYPKEGHGFTDPAHATDFLTRVGKFLDQYNPATP